MARRVLLLLLLLVAVCVPSARASSPTLNAQIYTERPTAVPCVRLLNATGVIGCQATAQTGVAYALTSLADIDAFVAGPVGASAGPFNVVMPEGLMSWDTVSRLWASGHMNGLTLLPTPVPTWGGAATDADYSPALQSPNAAFGLYPNNPVAWNANGTSLSFDSFTFPIFRVTSSDDAGAILAGASSNAASGFTAYPLFAIELDAFMWATSDTATCLQRGQCDPVGGSSVWASVAPIPNPPNKRLVMVSAPMDASAFFHAAAMGADADTTAVVALLAAAQAIGRLNGSAFEKDVVFALFNAEAWGFAGSQRFVQDVVSFVCTSPRGDGSGICNTPLQLSTAFEALDLTLIDAYFELSQVGGWGYIGATTPPPSVLYGHVDQTTANNTALLALLSSVANASFPPGTSAGFNTSAFFQPATGGQRLPPSSFQSFLQVQANIPGVVITEYNTAFANPYYHSTFDAYTVVNDTMVAIVCAAANLTAQTVWLSANPSASLATMPSALAVNCTTVSTLLNCLLNNVLCDLVQSYLVLSPLQTPLETHYAGVFSFGTYSLYAQFYHDLLGSYLATGTTGSCSSSSNCASNQQCIQNLCTTTSVYFHDAYGTGLLYNQNTLVYSVVNSSKAVWTESRWQATLLRTFRVASVSQQLGEFFGGFIILGLSIGTGIGIQRKIRRTLRV